MTPPRFPELLTPGEVADLFKVNSRTVARWANQGKLRVAWTPGAGEGPGNRRYFRAEINALVAGKPLTAAELDALVRGEVK